jgi:C-terminal processing protease CtpA/Prc
LTRAATPALVIDLRANEGGDDVGDLLLAHLTARPVRVDGLRRLVRYRRVPDDLAPCLDTWDPSFKDWGDAAKPFDDRFFRLTRYDDEHGDRIEPRAPRYRGRVFVLIGATNSSATFGFARTVKQSGLATLVGQPTGGNLRGINGGAFFFLRLPNSRIELDLPLIGYFPEGALPPDRGVDPDVLVERTVEDIAANVDVELRAVRRQLRSASEATDSIGQSGRFLRA